MNINFKPIPTTIIAISFCLIMYLGFWQLDRMNEKQELIIDINNKMALKGELFPEDFKQIPENEFKKYILKGKFVENKDMFLYGYNFLTPRAHGLNILTPFLTTDGRYIIVNRGWSAGKNSPSCIPNKTNSESDIEITTIVISKVKRGAFLPKNLLDKNLWLSPDLEEMRDFLGLNVQTEFFMTMIDENDPSIRDYHLLLPLHRNFISINYSQHIYYAITWFSIALTLLIITYFKAKKN